MVGFGEPQLSLQTSYENAMRQLRIDILDDIEDTMACNGANVGEEQACETMGLMYTVEELRKYIFDSVYLGDPSWIAIEEVET